MRGSKCGRCRGGATLGEAQAGGPAAERLDGHLDQERPPCLQRLPEAAVSIAAQVVSLHGDEANLVHLANVPEGRPVGCPAAYAVKRPLGYG